MKKDDIMIRPIQASDLQGAMRLSTEQGWNQTEADWMRIIAPPQNISLLAECHGKIIGTTAAMNYANKVAWINMVLVDKAYRRRGISKSLFENILKELNFCKSIKLDATTEGQLVYRHFDFKEEYGISRVTAEVVHSLPPDTNEPVPIQSKDLKEVIDFDESVFGANRTHLITSMVSKYPDKARLLKQNNVITGFALGRIGRKYDQIGPVMASSASDAISLITAALRKPLAKPLIADVLDDKTELRTWLNAVGFVQHRKFIRMYQHDNPFPGKITNHFLIGGPEYG